MSTLLADPLSPPTGEQHSATSVALGAPVSPFGGEEKAEERRENKRRPKEVQMRRTKEDPRVGIGWKEVPTFFNKVTLSREREGGVCPPLPLPLPSDSSSASAPSQLLHFNFALSWSQQKRAGKYWRGSTAK
ncbi:uncharacterized protein P884DRAFT_268361 [Thermothelomyces heterothallicus CBS 202.75]|uniref:uncharacterized protein n=1 Tax=Thermothelomyces heterothallicus CBS 202.75 TaxID=1149848 RepID=UPI003743722D